MASSYQAVDWVMMESLRILKNKMAISGYFYKGYNKEFKQPFAVNDVIRKKLPQQYLIRNGINYTPQEHERLYTEIKMDQIFGIDFDFDPVQKILNMERGEEQVRREYLEPAMSRLHEEIEVRCSEYAYKNCPNVVGALGTTPTSITPFHQARAKLVELAGWNGTPGMIISPSMHSTLGANLTTIMNPQREISDLFRVGLLGNAAGFKWYESAALKKHQGGTMTIGDCTVTTTLTNGATSVGITSAAAAVAWKEGDIISFTTPLACNPANKEDQGWAKTVVLTQDLTIAAGGGTGTAYFYPALYDSNSPYQNVDQLPQAGHVIVQFPGTTAPTGKYGKQALALGQDAFALVFSEFEDAKDAEISRSMRDPDSGIAISFLRQTEGRTRNKINRFDVLMGFGRLYAEFNSVRVASLL